MPPKNIFFGKNKHSKDLTKVIDKENINSKDLVAQQQSID